MSDRKLPPFARLAIALGIALLVATSGFRAQQPPRFTERVDVTRIIVDARVLDDSGDPVLGLSAGDFKVKIDGKPARVETATWVGGNGTVVDPAPSPAPAAGPEAPLRAGRLIVFLFQKDLEPSRIVGLMRMLLKSRNLLNTLTPDDRVAILSFDTHLKIWTDFTNDREVLDRLLAHDVLLSKPPPVESSGSPSLVRRLGSATARRTYGIEQALELIGQALRPLPGAKSLVLVGYGFGRLSFGSVFMEADYGPARQALVAARTSVFSLDVTDADRHSLEAGLQLISGQTGGFFARTHLFPDAALRRLSGALIGYYVLFVDEPEDRRAVHTIDVELARRKGRVLATSSFPDRGPLGR